MICRDVESGIPAHIFRISSTLITSKSHTYLHDDLEHRMPPSCQCPILAPVAGITGFRKLFTYYKITCAIFLFLLMLYNPSRTGVRPFPYYEIFYSI